MTIFLNCSSVHNAIVHDWGAKCAKNITIVWNISKEYYIPSSNLLFCGYEVIMVYGARLDVAMYEAVLCYRVHLL